MRLGGQSERWPGLVTAHRDPQVPELAELLAPLVPVPYPRRRLLFYTQLSLAPFPNAKLLDTARARLNARDASAVVNVDRITGAWRARLTAQQLSDYKGALFERIVARLIGHRRGETNILVERKVVLSDGYETGAFDVVGAGLEPWEAVECKVGPEIPFREGKEISSAAARAAATSDPLLVVIASAADQISLIDGIRDEVPNYRLVYFVAEDTLYDLAIALPTDTVTPA